LEDQKSDIRYQSAGGRRTHRREEKVRASSMEVTGWRMKTLETESSMIADSFTPRSVPARCQELG
jgi:hypothetical protein